MEKSKKIVRIDTVVSAASMFRLFAGNGIFPALIRDVYISFSLADTNTPSSEVSVSSDHVYAPVLDSSFV